MATTTVKLESKFFDTPQGEESLEKYNAWKAINGKGDSDEVKARRAKLVAAGLKHAVTKKLKGGNEPRIKAALQGEKEGLTAEEITAKISEVLNEEGNGETVTAKSIQTTCSFQGTKNAVTEEKDSWFLVKIEGEGEGNEKKADKYTLRPAKKGGK